MKRHFLLTGTAIAMMAFSACNDETLDLGNTLTGPADKLTTSSADYQVSTHTIMADSVLIKSSYCCIGNLKDSETGTYVKSDFMTQLNIQESFSLPDESTILNKYDGRACVDSCQLLFILKAPTAVSDTLAAMKMRIWELSSPMEEDKYYYSNYDPIKEGLIQEGAFYEDKVFSHYDLSEDDESIRHQYPFVSVRLDKPYTDKNGVTYKNYGTYIQTHCNEGQWEHDVVLERFGKTDPYVLYDFGLVNERSIMAHCPYLTEEEGEMFHVDPYGIKEYQRRWYLLGYCHERGAERVYALDRITSLTATGWTFKMPRDYDIDDLYSQTIGIYQDGKTEPESIYLKPVAAGESLIYYRKEGVHYVPKLGVDDLLV